MATCRSSRSSDAERVAKRSVLLGSFGLGGDNGGGDVVGLLLGLDDLDEIGHDLEGRSLTKLDGLHDLNLDSEHTLSEFDVTDGFVNEIVSGLSSGDLFFLVFKIYAIMRTPAGSWAMPHAKLAPAAVTTGFYFGVQRPATFLMKMAISSFSMVPEPSLSNSLKQASKSSSENSPESFISERVF